jgi:hypothetical protein
LQLQLAFSVQQHAPPYLRGDTLGGSINNALALPSLRAIIAHFVGAVGDHVNTIMLAYFRPRKQTREKKKL